MHALARERDARAGLSKQHVSGPALKARAPVTAPGQSVCACGGGCPRCKQKRSLQAKRAISQPGDGLEREADRVAEEVTRSPVVPYNRFADGGPHISRAAFSQTAPAPESAMASVDDALRSPGKPLDEATRRFMETRFQRDFDHVRIHTDAAAARSAQELSAQAYTSGNHIVFSAGHYAPHTPTGQRLVAHELAHVVQQATSVTGRVQRAPAPPRAAPAKVPTLTVPQTTRFFSDLNAALKKVLGGYPRLSLADFSILGGAAFAAFLKRSSDTSGYYLEAEQLAEKICSAITPDEFAYLCEMNQPSPACIALIMGIQADPGLCRRGRPTDALIFQSFQTRGVTLPRGGPSVVLEEAAQNDMLRNIVHEGVHRMRGAIWKQRSRSGIRYMHSRVRPPAQLDVIGKDLDEGTTQIITDLVIAELQKVRGRSWFRGYSSTTYASAVAKVRKVLSDHGKDTDFLKRAYREPTKVEDVEDLQLWQKSSWP